MYLACTKVHVIRWNYTTFTNSFADWQCVLCCLINTNKFRVTELGCCIFKYLCDFFPCILLIYQNWNSWKVFLLQDDHVYGWELKKNIQRYRLSPLRKAYYTERSLLYNSYLQKRDVHRHFKKSNNVCLGPPRLK